MPTPLTPPDYPDRPDAPLFAFGPSFGEEIARSVVAGVSREDLNRPQDEAVRLAASLTMLEAFGPANQLQCMIAAQGVAFHVATMDCLARAIDPATPPALALKFHLSAARMRVAFSGALSDVLKLQGVPPAGSPRRRRAKPPPAPSGPDADEGPADGPDADDGPIEDAGRPGAEANSRPDAAGPGAAANPRPGEPVASDKPPSLVPPSDLFLDPIPAQPRAPAYAPAPDEALNKAPHDPLTEEEPADIRIRPDGTPGSLAAYLPKQPEPVIPAEAAINRALATRPKLWRQVNMPKDQAPAGQESEGQASEEQAPEEQAPGEQAPGEQAPGEQASEGQALEGQTSESQSSKRHPPEDQASESQSSKNQASESLTPEFLTPNGTAPKRPLPDWPAPSAGPSEAVPPLDAWGPLDIREDLYRGDALARFASARFDPDAPIPEPAPDDAIIELELVNTGGDPEAEAHRAALIAAHPEGKPIAIFRLGANAPPRIPDPEDAPDTS